LKTRKFLFPVVALLLFLAFTINLERWREENFQKTIEISVDYDEVRNFCVQFGLDTWNYLDALKEAGVTTICFEETTLDNLSRDGVVTLLAGEEFRKFAELTGIDFAVDTEMTYVLTRSIDAADLVESGMVARLGRERVLRSWIDLGRQIPSRESGKAAEITADGKRYLIGIRGVDRPLHYMFSGGRQITPPPRLTGAPLGLDSRMLKTAETRGFNLAVDYRTDVIADDRLVNFLLSSLEGFEKRITVFFGGRAVLGYPNFVSKTGQYLERLNRKGLISAGMVEFLKPAGIETLFKVLEADNVIRIHTITPEEMTKLSFARARSRWLRAARERNHRFLLMRLFFQEGGDEKGRFMASVPLRNLRYVKQVRQGLEEFGYGVSTIAIHTPGRTGRFSAAALSVGVSLFAGILMAVMLCSSIRAAILWALPLVLLAIPLFMVKDFTLGRKIYALLAAVVFPALATLVAYREMRGPWMGFRSSLWSGLWGWFKGFVICICGILFITSLLYDLKFLLKLDQFMGVKAAFILPLAIVMLVYLAEEGMDIKWLGRPITVIHLFLGLIILGLIGIYIIRSGNTTAGLRVGAEDQIREWLETTLVSRPRTKEFLIGYPSLFLLSLLSALGAGVAKIPFLGGTCILYISIMNTFCHIHSPLSISVLRVFNGIMTGIPTGLVVMGIGYFIYLITKVWGRDLVVGYYGCGNLGDEAILEMIGKEHPDSSRLLVLSGNPRETFENHGIDGVDRKNPICVVAAILGSERVIFGGGGLIQDSTSTISAFYYLAVGILSILTGKPLLVFANGVGPLKSPRLREMASFFFSRAAVVTVRDIESAELVKTLVPGVDLKVVCDPCMGLIPSKDRVQSPERGILRIAVIPREWPGIDGPGLAMGLSRFIEQIVSVTGPGENFGQSSSISEVHLTAMYFQEVDETICSELVRELCPMSGPLVRTSVIHPTTSTEAIEIIAGQDCVLAVRFHGALFSIISRVPCVTINYDPKVANLARTFLARPGLEGPFGQSSMGLAVAGELLALISDLHGSRQRIESTLSAMDTTLPSRILRDFCLNDSSGEHSAIDRVIVRSPETVN
jgi:polysaccharide pyruvyl transferase CsaB